MCSISVIIPALNEAATVHSTLQPLQSWRQAGHEIILVDGGSVDNTVVIATPMVDSVLRSAPGRARQMNLAAQAAKGDILLFLHADTRLPDKGEAMVLEAVMKRPWGRFDVTLSGNHRLFRLVERLMNWRSCVTGIATGDQAIFVERELFKAAGGYPEQPLMEDIALSRELNRRAGRPSCLRPPLITSSRRWEENGILRTVFLMWRLRMAYFLGVSPHRLARRYSDNRAAANSAGNSPD